jgi:hypothetical protein
VAGAADGPEEGAWWGRERCSKVTLERDSRFPRLGGCPRPRARGSPRPWEVTRDQGVSSPSSSEAVAAGTAGLEAGAVPGGAAL